MIDDGRKRCAVANSLRYLEWSWRRNLKLAYH